MSETTTRWTTARVVAAVLALVLIGGIAGFVAWRNDRPAHAESPSPSDRPTPSATPSTPTADPEESPTRTPAPSPTETAKPEPAFLLKPGDRGVRVRELQHRLFQLAWLPELTTGRFDPATEEAVRGFQAKRGLPATGKVDRRTWGRLVSMSRRPNHDQLFNILHPGPAILAPGAEGDDVRDLQARLVQIAWLSGDVSGSYDQATTDAVRGFQAKREIPVTGEVDQRTLDRLYAMTATPTHEELYNIEPEPGALDARCLTGRVLCIDKSTNSLRWVVDGDVQATYDVRFGSELTPTREGQFTVYTKSRDHVSSIYDTEMPFAMFFSGGQAVHYSPDFAANGYNGASHGCVNVRDYDGIAWLYDQVAIGDTVIVYWS